MGQSLILPGVLVGARRAVPYIPSLKNVGAVPLPDKPANLLCPGQGVAGQ